MVYEAQTLRKTFKSVPPWSAFRDEFMRMSVRRSALEGSEAARSVADVGCDGYSGGKIGGGPKQSPVLLFDDDGDAVGKVRGASPFANGAKTTDTTAGGSTLDAASQPSTETVGSFEIR
jgi:hypothetical protein